MDIKYHHVNVKKEIRVALKLKRLEENNHCINIQI